MAGERILILGAGSIGRRHARNLRELGAEVTVTDPNGERAAATGAAVRPFDLEAIDGFDGIVVASPSVAHAAQAAAALATDAKVLVEKPLAHDVKELDELVAAGEGRIMVGYNLRLHEPVQRAVGLSHAGRVGSIRSVRAWFGSWLPDWRPGVDYRTTYSARAALGGGVLSDAIHELDLVIWTTACTDLAVEGALLARTGPLEIDVEDTVRAILSTPDGIAVDVSLDYLSRRYRRGLEVVGDEATLRLDWARQVIEVEDSSGIAVEPADAALAASYEREAAAFLAFVRDELPPPVGASLGAASVRLADAIRRAGTRS